jgi:hypothetical protein
MRTVVVDRFDRRYHGAVRFVDAVSGVEVRDPLTVKSTNGVLFRNRSGYYVIEQVVGLEAHEPAFATQPATPALGSITLGLTVSDARGRYLPRRAGVALPRAADPAQAHAPESLFQPADVLLYPSPIFALAPNWCAIHVHVARESTGTALPGVLLRVIRNTGGSELVIGRGVSDPRGEALVAIRGIPVTTWETGPGAVLATELAATREAVFVPAAPELPDPDDLEARRATLNRATAPVMLAAGRVIAMSVPLPAP